MGGAGVSTLTERVTSPARGRQPYPVARLHDGEPRTILFDAFKCIGCRQCVDACKDWNELPRGNPYNIGSSTWITIEPPVLEGQSSIWSHHSCLHCEYPLCAAVCPVEAVTKYDEGPVVIDPDKCIACEYCIHACPWHVVSVNDISKRAAKCTMCSDRIAHGAIPFCVQMCPVQALDFGTAQEMEATAGQRVDETAAAVYGRHEAGGTHLLHVLARSQADHGLPAVGPERYPRHHIPLGNKLGGLLTLRAGWRGKWSAIENAFTKPWRLKYRYWHRPSDLEGKR